MKLFTKEIDKKLFQQYPYGSDLESQKVVAKIFNPYGRGVWYIINSDPNDPDYLWAIVDLFEVEMGSVSRSELESIKVPPFGLHLERDSGFRPVNALELFQNVQQGKRYADGGISDVEVFEKDGKAYITPAGSDKNKPVVLFEDGGNLEMLKSQAIQFKHHADELSEVLKKNPEVHAWVVAKSERASSDLSDITHYLEGMTSKMANGGQLSMYRNGGGVGFNQYGEPYGFDDDYDIVYEWHYKEEDKQNPYKVWDKIDGVYVADFPSRQRAIEWIERNRYADGGNILSEDTVARVDDPAFSDVGQYAGGGSIPKEKSLRHFLLYEASAGMIANRSKYDKYKDIDGVRLSAVQILNRDGDREYSMQSFNDLIQEAVLEYEENKYGYSDGGRIKQEWVAVYRKTEKPNEHKVIMSYGNSKDEAIRNAEMSRGYHKIGKDYELINIYTRSGNLPMAGEGVGMFAGGGVTKYNKFLKEFGNDKDLYVSHALKFADGSHGFEVQGYGSVDLEKVKARARELGYTIKQNSINPKRFVALYSKDKAEARKVVRGYADDMPYEYAGGGGVSSLKMYEVEFTWKKKDEYDFDSRKVLIKAENIEQAQKLAKDKYGKYYEGFEIVEVEKEEDEKYANGGGVGFDMFPFEHNGIRYNVIDTNGVVNDRGQRLYKIDIEGYGSYNERAANIEIAKRNAIIDIDKIIEENGMFAGGGGVGKDKNRKYRYLPDGRLVEVKRDEIDPELKAALSYAEGSMFSQDFLNKYDIVKETYSTLKNENAEELAKNRRKQLKNEGYAVKIRKQSFVDLARGTGYFLTAVKRKYASGGAISKKKLLSTKR